jgi:hypothetical protein
MVSGKTGVVSRFILEVVEKQLLSGTPPETRETFERLVALGIDREEAKHLIGSAVVTEMRAVVEESRPFSRERFVSLLEGLPQAP